MRGIGPLHRTAAVLADLHINSEVPLHRNQTLKHLYLEGPDWARSRRLIALTTPQHRDALHQSAIGPGCVKTPKTCHVGGLKCIGRGEIVAYTASCEVEF